MSHCLDKSREGIFGRNPYPNRKIIRYLFAKICEQASRWNGKRWWKLVGRQDLQPLPTKDLVVFGSSQMASKEPKVHQHININQKNHHVRPPSSPSFSSSKIHGHKNPLIRLTLCCPFQCIQSNQKWQEWPFSGNGEDIDRVVSFYYYFSNHFCPHDLDNFLTHHQSFNGESSLVGFTWALVV